MPGEDKLYLGITLPLIGITIKKIEEKLIFSKSLIKLLRQSIENCFGKDFII